MRHQFQGGIHSETININSGLIVCAVGVLLPGRWKRKLRLRERGGCFHGRSDPLLGVLIIAAEGTVCQTKNWENFWIHKAPSVVDDSLML